MKYRLKQLISSLCTLVLLGNSQVASADLPCDTETLLNWAENTYPQFFPSREPHKAWSHGYIGSILKQVGYLPRHDEPTPMLIIWANCLRICDC